MRRCSGYDPSRLFHRSVNKRLVPDYYDIIKEPMAMSIIKARINKREYKQIADFVRDFALVGDVFGLYPGLEQLTDYLSVLRSPTMRRPTTGPSRKRTKMR